MAFNISTFKTRSITALLFVVIMLAGLFIHPLGYMALFFIIGVGGIWEWERLLRKIFPQGKNLKYWLSYLAGALYIILPVIMMVYLRLDPLLGPPDKWDSVFHGLYIPFGLILLLWTNDTMAYLVGSFIGKTPLSSISPKKTWEGTIGGMIITLGISLLLHYLFDVYRAADWLVFGGCAAIFGTIGDLLESKMKRLAGVKDSGTIMPGHGGFLDRFDSLLLAVPFVWLYVTQQML